MGETPLGRYASGKRNHKVSLGGGARAARNRCQRLPDGIRHGRSGLRLRQVDGGPLLRQSTAEKSGETRQGRRVRRRLLPLPLARTREGPGGVLRGEDPGEGGRPPRRRLGKDRGGHAREQCGQGPLHPRGEKTEASSPCAPLLQPLLLDQARHQLLHAATGSGSPTTARRPHRGSTPTGVSTSTPTTPSTRTSPISRHPRRCGTGPRPEPAAGARKGDGLVNTGITPFGQWSVLCQPLVQCARR